MTTFLNSTLPYINPTATPFINTASIIGYSVTTAAATAFILRIAAYSEPDSIPTLALRAFGTHTTKSMKVIPFVAAVATAAFILLASNFGYNPSRPWLVFCITWTTLASFAFYGLSNQRLDSRRVDRASLGG